ncbi:MAG: c-type cytochrome [Gammaproteobacteria bacterium]
MRRIQTLTLLMSAALLTLAHVGNARAASDPGAVVRNLYAAFEAGDLATVQGLVADDATWTYYGPDYVLPFAGVFRGPQGVGEFFRIVGETLSDVRAGQRQFLVAGDQVTVPGWEESTVKATGGRYRVDNVHLFTVRNGKIVKFEEFINSADVLEAFLPADLARGKALFTTCAGCHGNAAEGRVEVRAPALTGLASAYITRQLRNFRNGRRGSMADMHGFMMIGRASALPGDRGVRDVVAYIGTMPAVREAPQAKADLGQGKKYYESCVVCHGSKAEGNEGLSAPALSHLDSQYMLTQMRNFQTKVRGAADADVPGQQMAAAAAALRAAKAMRAVIAYIKSL